ncbi:unnamed protein product, partial [Rotaria sordida]
MSIDKFQGSRYNKPKTKALVKVGGQQQSEKLPILNLLQSNQSLLTNNQRTLLSKLLNDYNESKMLLLSQHLIDTHDTLQSNYGIYAALVEQYFISLYETTEAYLCSNDDFRHLSSHDRSIILRCAADK